MDKFLMRLAFALPRRLAYWCAIRVGVNAVTRGWSDKEVPALLFTDALKRW